MPRKRVELDREAKVGEILDRAVEILRSGDAGELTINRIASDLGIGRTAVYWYFPSRDDLFLAAAERLLAESLSVPPRTRRVDRQVEWAVEVLAELYPVYSELLQLAATHNGAATFLTSFQIGLCDALKGLLSPHVEPAKVQAVADTFVMFVEGLLGRRLPAPERRRHVRFALSTLVPDATPSPH